MKGKRDKRNFEKVLDEVIKFKEEIKTEYPKTKNNYINTSRKYATQVLNQLSKSLDRMDSAKTEEEAVAEADVIFRVLLETNLTSLEQIKDDYDLYKHYNDKFNS